jgi:hypothetical protein
VRPKGIAGIVIYPAGNVNEGPCYRSGHIRAARCGAVGRLRCPRQSDAGSNANGHPLPLMAQSPTGRVFDRKRAVRMRFLGSLAVAPSCDRLSGPRPHAPSSSAEVSHADFGKLRQREASASLRIEGSTTVAGSFSKSIGLIRYFSSLEREDQGETDKNRAPSCSERRLVRLDVGTRILGPAKISRRPPRYLSLANDRSRHSRCLQRPSLGAGS